MKTLFTGLSFFCVLLGQSQSLMFPNNNSALLLMNPSFAGITGGTRIQSSSTARNLTERSRSHSSQASCDTYLEKIKAGIGVSFTDNRSSFFSESAVNLTWAQHFELAKNRVKIISALSLGYRRNTIDGSVFSSLLPAPVSQKLVRNQGVIGASVLLELYERLYVGVALTDLNLVNDFNVKPGRIRTMGASFNASYNLQLSKNDLLQGVIRIARFTNFQQTQIGANYLHKKLLIGAGVSAADVTYIQLGYKSDLLTISAQSELVVSKLAGKMPPFFGINIAATIRGDNSKPVWKSVETW